MKTNTIAFKAGIKKEIKPQIYQTPRFREGLQNLTWGLSTLCSIVYQKHFLIVIRSQKLPDAVKKEKG